MPGKNVSPPPLPQDVLARVLRVAHTDGRLLMIVASVFAFFSAAARDATGTVAGVLAAGVGAMELHGVSVLLRGEPRGLRWLVAGQALLLLVILGYVATRLSLFDAAAVEALLTPDLTAQFEAAGVPPPEIVPMVKVLYQFVYAAVALGSVAYQGGMIWYFLRRRTAVEQALEQGAPVEQA